MGGLLVEASNCLFNFSSMVERLTGLLENFHSAIDFPFGSLKSFTCQEFSFDVFDFRSSCGNLFLNKPRFASPVRRERHNHGSARHSQRIETIAASSAIRAMQPYCAVECVEGLLSRLQCRILRQLLHPPRFQNNAPAISNASFHLARSQPRCTPRFFLSNP